MFNPKDHLLQLPRRLKDPATGQWVTRQEAYLPVRARIMAFRERYPQGTIDTKPLTLDVERGFACFEATATTGDGGRAVAHGSECRASFEDFIERSETRAVGRCLGLLGFGTEYALDMDELPHVADAPVAQGNGQAGETLGEGIPQGHHGHVHAALTADEVSALVELAHSVGVASEAFGHDMQRLMALAAGTKITKKFLRASMTQAQYEAAWEAYSAKLRQEVEQSLEEADAPVASPPGPDVPDFAPPTGEVGECSSVSDHHSSNGDAPPPTTIPAEAGLPCGGVGIATLKPAQLAMLVGKVARLAQEQGGQWGTLLAALQAERQARLTKGQRSRLTAVEGGAP